MHPSPPAPHHRRPCRSTPRRHSATRPARPFQPLAVPEPSAATVPRPTMASMVVHPRRASTCGLPDPAALRPQPPRHRTRGELSDSCLPESPGSLESCKTEFVTESLRSTALYEDLLEVTSMSSFVTGEELTHPRSVENEVSRVEMPVNGAKPRYLSLSISADDDCPSVNPETTDASPEPKPEDVPYAGAGIPRPDVIFREECELSYWENAGGFRLRNCHLEVLKPRTEGRLDLLDTKEILVRERGSGRRFLVNQDDVPCMRFISVDQFDQAVFEMQTFFNEMLGREITAFKHKHSGLLMGVCPDTEEVEFMPGASSDDDKASRGVVPLHGSSTLRRPPSVDDVDSGAGPDPCYQFVVETEGETSIRPVLDHDHITSLAVTRSGSGLTVVEGVRWSFMLIPPDQAEKIVKKLGLRRLLKKAFWVVLVVGQRA